MVLTGDLRIQLIKYQLRIVKTRLDEPCTNVPCNGLVNLENLVACDK